MDSLRVRKAPLPWWAAGLLLGFIQIAAVAVSQPLGVSTQFVVADAKVLEKIAPEYVKDHPLIGSEKSRKIGYGWWLDVGLVCGALVAGLATRRSTIRATTAWWVTNRGPGIAKRFVACFLGGFLILLGARFAHGCTSGQFASGWAQLSLSALPFTVTLFGFGMLTAWFVYPKSPESIEE